MATAVNNLNSIEFIKIDEAPVNEIKDDATSVYDPIQVIEHEHQLLKEEVNLDWEHNETDMNDSTTINTMGSIDTIPLEDMPIIILQQPPELIKSIIKNKTSLVCTICHKTFQNAQTLQEHAVKCNLIGCPLCDFRTLEESAFKEHWKSHPDSKKMMKQSSTLRKNGNSGKGFECPNCSKKYRTRNHLKLHMYKCEKTRCRLCDYATYKSYDLRRHFQNTHLNPEEVSKVCPRCNKILKNAHSLSTHMWICGKNPRCECHDCGYKTFNKYNLRTHILAKHLQPGVFREDPTNKQLQTDQIFVPLIIETDPLSQKVCQLCNKTFNNQRGLSVHSVHCKLYQCNHCPFETFIKAQLKKHIHVKHKPKQVPSINQQNIISSVPKLASSISKCVVSSPVSKLASSISQSVVSSPVLKLSSLIKQHNISSPVPELTSPISQHKISSSVPTLASPISQHDISSPCAEIEQMCKICYEIFQNEDALRAHALTCREYKCTHCVYKTYIQADLKNHVIQKHEQNGHERRTGTVCPKCGNRYKNKHVVNTHLKYCGKDFKKCDYCSFKSRRPGVLSAHVKLAHPTKLNVEKEEEDEDEDKDEEEEEVEIITCNICGQKLKNNETMAFHSFYCPRKPFLSCNMCSFKTRYGLCLKNHILRVHCQSNQESWECPKCSGKLKTPETFKKHLVACIPQSVLRCSLCTYMTRDPSCLSDHVLDKHYKDDASDSSDIKLIPCPKCGNKLKNPLSLRSHLMYCEKEPRLQCAYCPFKAKMKVILDRHVFSKHKAKK